MVLSLGLKPAARMRLFQFGYCSLQLGYLAESMNFKIKKATLEVLVRNCAVARALALHTNSFTFQGSSLTPIML